MPVPVMEERAAATVAHEPPLPTGPILAAVDGSNASDAPLPMAWTLAGRTGADVQVVSVLEPLPMAAEIAALANLSALRAEQREAQLGAVRAQLGRTLPRECTWPVELIEGTAATALARHAMAQRASLLVSGRGRHGMAARLFDGDTTARMLRFGDTPVLAVEDGAVALPRRIVAAIDFSAYSVYAARVALSIAAEDALVYLVHVRPHARFAGPAATRWEHEYAAAVPALLESVRDRLGASPAMQVETIVLSGAAAPAIAAFARSANADLVVAGTHGYGFLNRLVLGSVATELLHDAPASLLCVPGSSLTHAAVRDERSAALRARSVERGAWGDTVADFSRRFTGAPCTLEWMPSGGSRRTIELGHPLVGAAYDERDGAVTLMTGAGRLEGPHTSHFVGDVRSIDVLLGDDGETRGLRVLGRRGITTLRLVP